MSDQKSPSVQRFEFFSDGVLAIIMTIMAIELKIAELHVAPVSSWDFHFLLPEIPKLLSYALGFFMIATGWVSHLALTRILQRTSVYLITVNLIWLFLVSLLPAATAFLGDNPTLPQAVMIWSAVACATLIVGDQTLTKAARRLGLPVAPWVGRRNLVASILAILAIITPLFSVYPSWVLVFLAYSLQWIPGPSAARLFGPKPKTVTAGKDDGASEAGAPRE